LLENAIAEINAPSEFATEILSSALLQIMLYVILDFRTESSVTKRTVSAQEDICYQIMHYIDTHIYTMDSLSELSGWMNYNYSYLSDLFKTVTGDTLQNYYQSRRLRAAQLLLSEGRLKLGEIANLLRYSSIYSFSRAFKDKYGIPPSEYRRK
jgi:AraC-like DNA-binding protein